MKVKVLLVDDEKLERALIRKGCAWDEMGFEIVGEASNGEEALEFFCARHPNIVITDINMPDMDGLVLTEKILECSPKCRVIIITGYREFEYARRAVKLGVKDFILKPVNVQHLTELANTIKEEIIQEEGYDREYSQLKETAAKNQDIVMESFLQLLVEERIEEEEALHKLQIYNFETLAASCLCINIKPYLNQPSTQTLTSSKQIIQLLRKTQYGYSVAFVHYLCNVVLYFHNVSLEQARTTALEIKEQINAELHIHADIGISQVNTGFRGISKAFRQASKAINASVVTGRNSCIPYDEYAAIKKQYQGHCEIDWQDFCFNMENCLNDNIEKNIDEYTRIMKYAGITGTDYLKLMAMNMLSKASNVLNKHGKSLGQLIGEEDLYEQVSGIQNAEEMSTCLKAIIRQILIFNDSIRIKKRSKLIDQAVEYIEANLNEPNLTLKSVAKQIYTNESYLSRVFKQEKGEGLIEYITRKRIEQSILLLNTTDLKAYEIAEKIGFSDSHYFSICFKKQVGITIKEYKKPKF